MSDSGERDVDAQAPAIGTTREANLGSVAPEKSRITDAQVDPWAQINEELVRGGGPIDFSPQGAAELAVENARITTELAVTAIRMARADNLDIVSRNHVSRASYRFTSVAESQSRAWALAFGGVFGGAGLQELVNFLVTDPAPPKFRIVLMIALLLSGLGMLLYGLLPSRRR